MPLEDLVVDVLDRRGVTPLKLGSEFRSRGHRVISAKLFKNGRIDLGADEPRFVDEPTYRRWMRTPPLEGDVIVTSDAPLGEVAYIGRELDWCLGQRLFAVRPDQRHLVGRYLYCAMRSAGVMQDLHSRASGTTVLGVRQTELRRVRIPVPPLRDQHAIASVLGTLDDKIGLKQRMSETLQATARALFRSWFVDFDPVRAKTEARPSAAPDDLDALFSNHFDDTPMGLVPSGWPVTQMSVQAQAERGVSCSGAGPGVPGRP